ncbi:MAG: hypothetical protein OXG92_09075 [Chloroflexi bacterium]|nr:hypothetical protein [Chloroflexota bacterium]MCY3716601.1 hypothetical protein [Chloroflexota bacterium]MXV92781.1 hypothetical protein [Chloroflexota bacterium]MXX52379.1 hypothetical protein [Chloroflexota bacterium]MYA93898.1 hypothetical protein [Chloroflexota bacterium]
MGAGQSNSSAATAGNATGEIDNCCFVGWQCNNDQDWANGYHAYRNNQRGPATTATEPESCCEQGLIIEGSEVFITKINTALDLLKSRAPQWHAYVAKGPAKIGESAPGSPDGYATDDSIFISPSAAAKPAHVLALLLVHEACHVQRTLAGLLRYGTEQEQNLEESLAGYLVGNARSHIEFGRDAMVYSPTQVARLIRDGRLELPISADWVTVTYITRDVAQLLREGIDVFGAVRAELARAKSLLR